MAGLAAVVALVLHRGVRFALPVFAVALLAIGLWWSGLRPSNERDWQPEVARLAYATIDVDLVTVHNIRNFDYRTETDFTPAYYVRTYDLNKLDSADLVAVYWMGPAIAHLFLSLSTVAVAPRLDAPAARRFNMPSGRGSLHRRDELELRSRDFQDVADREGLPLRHHPYPVDAWRIQALDRDHPNLVGRAPQSDHLHPGTPDQRLVLDQRHDAAGLGAAHHFERGLEIGQSFDTRRRRYGRIGTWRQRAGDGRARRFSQGFGLVRTEFRSRGGVNRPRRNEVRPPLRAE